MKHLFLISALLVLFNSSFGCGCGSNISFCYCHKWYDLSTSCVIVDSFSHGISLKVLHVLNGAENRDTIKVWDMGGPYNMCNDSLTNSRAALLGKVGDTLIIALPKIDTIINPWDVIGDYVTLGFNCTAYNLKVVNNTVTGLISGTFNYPQCSNCIWSYNYDNFISDFPTKSLSCQTWLSTNDVTAPERLSFYPTPFESSLSFSGDIVNRITSITATDIIGQTVPVVVSGNTVSFPNPSASGLYIINTTLSDGNVLSHKVLKQ